MPFDSVFARVVHPPEFVRDYLDAPGRIFLRAQNVKPGRIENREPVFVPESVYRQLPDAIAKTDDILLVRTGANLADLARVTAQWDGAMVSSHTLRLIPQPNAPVCAMELFFISSVGRDLLLGLRSGGTHGQINADNLKDLKLPDLSAFEPKARRIGAQVEVARANAEAAMTAAETLLLSALGLDHLDLSPSRSYARPFKDLLAEGRFDAEFFHPRSQAVLKQLRRSGVTIGDVAPLAERAFKTDPKKKCGTFRYIEIGSLTGGGEAEPETIDVAEAPSRAQFIVQPGDIITSTVRPIRRLTALIREDQGGCVCSSGFAVLSPSAGNGGIEPEVLLAYLRLPLVCEVLDLHCTASMYPAIPVDRLLKIPVMVPEKRVRTKVVEHVRAALSARQEAARLLEQAKRTVEEIIAGTPGAK